MARKPANSQSPSLQREKIVQAALGVLDREGLENLTLRRVASELEVQAPALYWYFKNKTELVDYMAEAMLQEEFHDITERRDESWQEWLLGTMIRLRKAMWAHRDGARIVAGAHLMPAVTLLRIFEVSFASLVSAGLSLRMAHNIVITTVHFAFGRVIEEQASPTPEQLREMDFTQLFGDFPLFLQILTTTSNDDYDDFAEGIRLIIDGASCRRDAQP